MISVAFKTQEPRTVLFADDTKCYRGQRSPQDHLMLQYDLNGLVSWSYDWDLNFNPSNCDVLKISRKRNSAFRNYTIEANALSETNLVKHLGVVISSTLSWKFMSSQLSPNATNF